MSKIIPDIFSERFKEKDYIPVVGAFKEQRLLGVNHICIHNDCIIYGDIVLPYGAKDIEEKTTLVIDEILQEIVHILNSKENIEKKIIVCGTAKVKKMLTRKLEDRLKREIKDE